MEAKIVELTSKIGKVKNSCHKMLLIEERARLIAKSNEQKRNATIKRAPAVGMKTRKYLNLKTRKVLTEEELKTHLSELGYDEARRVADLWVKCA